MFFLQVLKIVANHNAKFSEIDHYCTKADPDFTCNDCVCWYRNNLVTFVLNEVAPFFNQRIVESMELFPSTDISERIDDFKTMEINKNLCSKTLGGNATLICDKQDYNGLVQHKNENIHLKCFQFFMCGITALDVASLTVTADSIFLDNTQVLQTV